MTKDITRRLDRLEAETTGGGRIVVTVEYHDQNPEGSIVPGTGTPAWRVIIEGGAVVARETIDPDTWAGFVAEAKATARRS